MEPINSPSDNPENKGQTSEESLSGLRIAQSNKLYAILTEELTKKGIPVPEGTEIFVIAKKPSKKAETAEVYNTDAARKLRYIGSKFISSLKNLPEDVKKAIRSNNWNTESLATSIENAIQAIESEDTRGKTNALRILLNEYWTMVFESYDVLMSGKTNNIELMQALINMNRILPEIAAQCDCTIKSFANQTEINNIGHTTAITFDIRGVPNTWLINVEEGNESDIYTMTPALISHDGSSMVFARVLERYKAKE